MNDSKNEGEIGPLNSDADPLAVRALTEESLPSGDVDQQAINEAFRVLSKPEQRYVLTYLLRSDGEITISSLVDYVITETSVQGSEETFRKEVTSQLTHVHLPELVNSGFIEYNMERQLIRQTEQTALVEPYIKIALSQQSLLADQTSD